VAAPTEIYVDPAINANSGSGTIGDPYGDLEYGLTTFSRDATNGNRINIKAGTDEMVTGSLSFPGSSSTVPTILEGYTSVAGDGGLASLNLGGGAFNLLNGWSYSTFRRLKIHNSAATVTTSTGSTIYDCEFSNFTATAVSSMVVGCFFTDCSGYGMQSSVANGCFFLNGTKKFSICVSGSVGTYNCIFAVDGSTSAISPGYYTTHFNNSILATGSSTGTGYKASGHSQSWLFNSVVEGMGTGFAWSADQIFGRHNAAYNNGTNYSGEDWSEDNEVLPSSGFAKTGSIPTDFSSPTFWADLYAYFTPLNVGNMWSGFGHMAKGAVQPTPGGGSGGLLRGGSLTGGFQ
jgi:hypothetical protein